jgi:hypothetical protein
MKVILSVPDEGYSKPTWWRLFKEQVVCTKLDIYILIVVEILKRFYFSITVNPH